jgi:diglucosylglycerate octanoyltransferase
MTPVSGVGSAPPVHDSGTTVPKTAPLRKDPRRRWSAAGAATLRRMPRLVVVADSLSFHGTDGPLPLADPRLYPNILGAHLAAATGADWDVAVVARAGWGVREVWLALQRDVHLQQQLLVGADAVVLGAGSSDSLSVGVPRPLMAVLPFLRPTSLRRRVRRGIDHHHHRLVALSGARIRHTPMGVYRHGWRKSVEALRLFAPDAALCAVAPAIHVGGYYAGRHPFHAEALAATRALAAELGVPLVDLPRIMRPHLDGLNRDGIHWSYPVHADVAAAMAEALVPQLRDERRPATG